MTTENLVITGQGLTRISRELINKRKFDTTKITKVGSPILTNEGSLGGITESSYVQYEYLDLASASSITISSVFTYVSSPTSEFQCLWSLNDKNAMGSTLSCLLYSNKIVVTSGKEELFEIDNIPFKNNCNINFSIKLFVNGYDAVVIISNERFVFSGSTKGVLAFTNYNQIQVGVSNTYPANYWFGTIDLSNFIIKKDNSIYYSPSTKPSFSFSHILASDSTTQLEDSSLPVLKHVYAFPIEEIDRTSNYVLLKVTIGERAHLDISEIGLYVKGEEGNELFATVSGLTIKKGTDLDYELILNVNLNLGVVNTTAFPNIIVLEEDQAVYKDFTDIKKVYAYIIENMEKIIIMNALRLGYGEILKIMKDFMKSLEWGQNCLATQRFSRIKEKIFPHVEKSFNKDKVNTQGEPIVSKTGKLSSITTSDYCYSNSFIDFSDDWSLEFAFRTGLGGTEQTLLDMYSPVTNHPLILSLDENGRCLLKLGRQDSMTVNNGTNVINLVREPQMDRLRVASSLYAWSSEDGLTIYNYHINSFGSLVKNEGSISNFSTTNYATSTQNVSLIEGSRISVNFKLTSSTEGQTLISSNENYKFLVEEKNGYILYSFGNGTSWTSTKVVGTNKLEVSGSSNLNIEYKNGKIGAYINGVLDFSATNSEVKNTILKLGLDSNNTNPLNGSIGLKGSYYELNNVTVWTGVAGSNGLFTNVITPISSSSLYDKDGVILSGYSIGSVSTEVIFNGAIFNTMLTGLNKVKIVFSDSKYKVYLDYDESGKYILIKEISSSSKIGSSVTQYFGVGVNGVAGSSFNGEIELKDYIVTTEEGVYDFLNKVQIKTLLKNYFPLYEYSYNYYKVFNIEDKSKYIIYNDGSLTGNSDLIDFSNPNSSTFSVKIKLDPEDFNKPESELRDVLILAKINPTGSNERYFAIKFTKERTFVVTIYMEDGTVVLQKQYPREVLNFILSNEILLSIKADVSVPNPVLSMYINNELVDTTTLTNKDFKQAGNFVITNYLDDPNTASKSYVRDILFFEGIISQDELYYINNLLDTNF